MRNSGTLTCVHWSCTHAFLPGCRLHFALSHVKSAQSFSANAQLPEPSHLHSCQHMPCASILHPSSLQMPAVPVMNPAWRQQEIGCSQRIFLYNHSTQPEHSPSLMPRGGPILRAGSFGTHMGMALREPGSQPPLAYTEQSPPVQLSWQWQMASLLQVPCPVQLLRQRPSLVVVRL